MDTFDSNPTPQWAPSDPFATTKVISTSGLSATNSWDAPVRASGTTNSLTAAFEANHNSENELSKQMETTFISNERPRLNEDGSSIPPGSAEVLTATLEEIWPMFQEADLTRDLDDVKPALAKLCEVYQGKSWTDLENKLREEKCNTYLVATMDSVSFGYTLVNLRGEPDQEFRVIPSFIKPGSVKRGRMAVGMASSYEENLARLERAGVVRPSGVPRCHNCKQAGHILSDCPEGKREPEKSEYYGKCYNCGSEEHRTRTCPQPRKVMFCRNCNQEGHMAKNCTEDPAPIICNRCKAEGHMSRDCDQARSDMSCYRCGNPNHTIRECPEPRTDVTCNRCNQPGHIVRDCQEPRSDVICIRCSQPGHVVRDCSEPRTDVTCNRCGQFGHMVRECPEPRTDVTCNRCGQLGHMRRDCEQPRQMSSMTSQTRPNRSVTKWVIGFLSALMKEAMEVAANDVLTDPASAKDSDSKTTNTVTNPEDAL
ncbi:hypothetical protein BGZ49_000455 [Haplosporangium sp. Z 27]|nr:hypothetical protein BGZ49_000455 [Haplosporangium sp. Z 27]